eukprot:1292122-Amphidinium_carterae.1
MSGFALPEYYFNRCKQQHGCPFVTITVIALSFSHRITILLPSPLPFDIFSLLCILEIDDVLEDGTDRVKSWHPSDGIGGYSKGWPKNVSIFFIYLFVLGLKSNLDHERTYPFEKQTFLFMFMVVPRKNGLSLPENPNHPSLERDGALSHTRSCDGANPQCN